MRREPCLNADGSRKHSYKSRATAEHYARRTTRDDRNDQPLTAYFCKACRHFHVGHDGMAAA
jgi:hypothetical protein